MLYEMRTYEALPGRLQAVQSQFRDGFNQMFQRHGMQVVGYWTYVHGGWSDQLLYLMAFEDAADRERKWAAFYADPQFREVLEMSGGAPAVARIRSEILRPTDYSPLQ